MSIPPPFITDSVQRAYVRFGIPELFLKSDSGSKSLAQLLDIAEPHITRGNYRLFPTSFSPEDANLRAFPRPLTWRWTSAERALRLFNARAVMTRVPHFWQLEPLVHAACRNVGAPLFTNEVENIPLGGAAMVSAEINVVITSALDAAAFSSYLLEHQLPLPSWILIHQADAEWNVPGALLEGHTEVAQEVHLFPGVPILEQCHALMQTKMPHFHLSDAYFWDIEEGQTRIISIGDDPLPLYRYRLPFALETKELCACGKITVAQQQS